MFVVGLGFDVGKFSFGDVWGNSATIKVRECQTPNAPQVISEAVYIIGCILLCLAFSVWVNFHSHAVKDQQVWHIAFCSITFLPLVTSELRVPGRYDYSNLCCFCGCCFFFPFPFSSERKGSSVSNLKYGCDLEGIFFFMTKDFVSSNSWVLMLVLMFLWTVTLLSVWNALNIPFHQEPCMNIWPSQLQFSHNAPNFFVRCCENVNVTLDQRK